jgi:hypothetical protein
VRHAFTLLFPVPLLLIPQRLFHRALVPFRLPRCAAGSGPAVRLSLAPFAGLICRFDARHDQKSRKDDAGTALELLSF